MPGVGAVVPPLQMCLMEAAREAPNLASAVDIVAFNLGNAIGAALGGALIKAGGWRSRAAAAVVCR